MIHWVRRDMAKTTLTMEKPGDPAKELEFTFSNPDSQSLTLQGSDGENEIRVKLHLEGEKQFAVLGGGFHWIDDDADWVMDEERVCDRVRRPGRALLAR